MDSFLKKDLAMKNAFISKGVKIKEMPNYYLGFLSNKNQKDVIQKIISKIDIDKFNKTILDGLGAPVSSTKKIPDSTHSSESNNSTEYNICFIESQLVEKRIKKFFEDEFKNLNIHLKIEHISLKESLEASEKCQISFITWKPSFEGQINENFFPLIQLSRYKLSQPWVGNTEINSFIENNLKYSAINLDQKNSTLNSAH